MTNAWVVCFSQWNDIWPEQRRRPIASKVDGYVDAVESSMEGIDYPIVNDIDMDRQSPQMMLMQGAMAEITGGEGRGGIF